MTFIQCTPVHGDERIVSFFAWFPVSIVFYDRSPRGGGRGIKITKWLEKVKIKQRFNNYYLVNDWENEAFIEEPKKSTIAPEVPDVPMGFTSGQKVYYVNGWPNNGFGYYVKYNPLLKKFTVKLRYGLGSILADRVIDLEAAMKSKEENVANLEKDLKSLGPALRDIYEGNKEEIETGKEFLNE